MCKLYPLPAPLRWITEGDIGIQAMHCATRILLNYEYSSFSVWPDGGGWAAGQPVGGQAKVLYLLLHSYRLQQTSTTFVLHHVTVTWRHAWHCKHVTMMAYIPWQSNDVMNHAPCKHETWSHQKKRKYDIIHHTSKEEEISFITHQKKRKYHSSHVKRWWNVIHHA